MLKRRIAAALALLVVTPACAEETWTDLGIYLFATGIEGEVQTRNVTADVDVGFDDILDNLDLGFMGYIEHRRGKWSFIGDVAYLKVSDDESTAFDGRSLSVEVELDAEFAQTVFEGFVGYRIFEREYEAADLGVDLLVGARYTELEIDLSAEATLLGPIPSQSRENDKAKEEDWTDTVLALRLQYGGRKGWGSSFWLDVGDGSDSSSEQFMALASYRGDSWQFFGGYRYLNLEYEAGSDTSKFGVDLDYTGPMFAAVYRL
jgi:hypothetical protein